MLNLPKSGHSLSSPPPQQQQQQQQQHIASVKDASSPIIMLDFPSEGQKEKTMMRSNNKQQHLEMLEKATNDDPDFAFCITPLETKPIFSLDDLNDETRRRVRFDLEGRTEVHESISLSQYTDFERRGSFYGRYEFQFIMHQAKQQAMTQAASRSSGDFELTGLESMTPFGRKRFKLSRTLALQTVLNTQRDTARRTTDGIPLPPNDETMMEIATAYENVCRFSTKQALKRGQLHAKNHDRRRTSEVEKPSLSRRVSLESLQAVGGRQSSKRKGFWQRRQSLA